MKSKLLTEHCPPAAGAEEDAQPPPPEQSQPFLVRISARRDAEGAFHDSLHGSPLAYAHGGLTAAGAVERWPYLRRDSAQPQAPPSPQEPALAALDEEEDGSSTASQPISRPNGSAASPSTVLQSAGNDADDDAAQTRVNGGGGAKGAKVHGEEGYGAQDGLAGNKLLQMPQVPPGRLLVLVAMFLGMHPLLGKLPCCPWNRALMRCGRWSVTGVHGGVSIGERGCSSRRCGRQLHLIHVLDVLHVGNACSLLGLRGRPICTCAHPVDMPCSKLLC